MSKHICKLRYGMLVLRKENKMSKEPVYYPLTTAQQIMYVSQKYSLKKSIVDICTMLHFDCELDENLLLQAIHMAMLRNESSRVRLHKVGKEIRQYISDQAPEAVIVMDYSDRTEEELEADINRWSQTAFPNKSMDVQLYSIRLIRKPNGFLGLYFCVSHLAFDAYALMAIAGDMLSIYVALRDGLPIPPAKGNYMKLCETDWQYQKSEKRQKSLEFWEKEVCDSEPILTSVEPSLLTFQKGKRYGTVVSLLNSSAYHVNLKIEADLVSKIKTLANGMNLPEQCFYILAIRSYLSKMNGEQEDITFNNSVSRRSTLLQKNSGGTRVLAVPFRMNYSNDWTALEGAKAIHAMQKRCYPHSDVLITDISQLWKTKYNMASTGGYCSMSLTFNPFTVKLPEGIKMRLNTFSNGANSQPIYLSIMAQDDSGRYNCNYDCMKKFTTPETAPRMHEHIVKALTAIGENPDITLRELCRL